MTALTEPVAIVGGGAGGLATVAAQRLLEQWGAWEFVEELNPWLFTRFQILNGDGRQLLHLDIATQLGTQYRTYALRHRDIVRALRHAAESSGTGRDARRRARSRAADGG
jgi:2-polyprenyl-6-methoxyphenol hydroxylase-like FAD-dependent oxidoreductase